MMLTFILGFAGVLWGTSVSGVMVEIEKYKLDAGVPMYPEGVAFDRNTQTLYLSSIAGPQIFGFAAENGLEFKNIYHLVQPSSRICLGLEFDHERNRLWCALSDFTASTLTATDGALVSLAILDFYGYGAAIVHHREEFQPTNGTIGAANDVTLDSNGIVYVTDWQEGVVYEYDPEDYYHGGLRVVSDSPLLDKIQLSGSNGLVAIDDYVITASLDRQALVRVEISTGETTDIKVDANYTGDGLLILPDRRLVICSGSTLVVVEEVEGSNWEQAQTLDIIELDVDEGEFITTATLGKDDLEVYATAVRFGDLFGPEAPGPNMNPSTVFKVNLPPRSHEVGC